MDYGPWTLVVLMFAIRVFVAVAISDDLRSRLLETVDSLKNSGARVRWVPPDNLHISMAFIGNIFDDKVEAISNAIDEAVSGYDPFEVHISRIGTFGKPHAPRVIWAGVENDRKLHEIYAKLKDLLAALDIKLEDRAFKPHVTLGRVKSHPKGCGLPELIDKQRDSEFGTLAVTSVELMKSELSPDGAVYSVLHKAEL